MLEYDGGKHLKIQKRNGEYVDYDAGRILRAIRLAGLDEKQVPSVFESISNILTDGVHVEWIQDRIEEILMHHDDDVAKRYILYRESRAQQRIKPNPNAISDYILHSKYAKKGEDWEEVVNRNATMHCLRWPELEQEILEVYDDYVLPKKVLPSMRSLQFAGSAIESHNARMFNCSFSHCNRIDFFGEMFYLLLAGCGVGYSVQRHHVAMLPEFKPQKHVTFYALEDTIESWADAIKLLLYGAEEGSYVEFDYSRIRPAGSPLSSGGVAPGHVPLKLCIEKIREMIPVGKLTPIQAHDICCVIAMAVLSGGIRRSSLISLFSPDDQEMVLAKTGDWFNRHPWRSMANNSGVFLRGDFDKPAFDKIFDSMKEYGEPGFFFTNNLNYGTNPCGEIGLNPGPKSFSFCNLTEINGATVEGDLIERARAAAFIGTLQAAYTDFKYLNEQSKFVADEQALLGVSITGIMDNSDCRDSVLQYEAAKAAVEENARVADIIGIFKAQRVTTVKPSGTASLLLGGIGSGHHSHHSERYIRRVTANPREPVFQEFRKQNSHMCEEKPNGDWVISFPMLAPSGSILVEHLKDTDFMDKIFATYANWIVPGSSTVDLTHNISCTVSVQNWNAVKVCLLNNLDSTQAMSFIQADSKKYPYMPREAVRDSVQFAQWKALIDGYKSVEYSSGMTDRGAACEGDVCDV